MKWLKNLFGSVKSFFVKLFGVDAEDFMDLIEKLSPLVNKAYPIVKKIADLTPNKTDDAILAAYESLGFTGVFKPGTDKGLALRDLAKKVLNATTANPVSDYLANTAIELAYAKFKESKKDE
jgi:hypothetical protein